MFWAAQREELKARKEYLFSWRRLGMNKEERILAVVQGKPVDRVPVSFWWHYPEIDDDPKLLAEAIVRDHREYDSDFIKMMPSGMYGVEDWGCEVGDPDPEMGFKRLLSGPIRSPEDWKKLSKRNPQKGARGRELHCLREVRRAVGPGIPVLQTVFSPLTSAAKLAGRDLLLTHMRENVPALQSALETISATEEDFIAACFEWGASGIFFATQFAGDNLLTPADHEKWCMPLEKRLLEQVRKRSSFSIMHLHGQSIFFDRFKRYPVTAMSWEDGSLSMTDGRETFPGVVVGGLDRAGWVCSGSTSEVKENTGRILSTMGKTRFVLAPGCVMSLRIPRENLRAIRELLG
jgi:uroporphyrinogen decarboxylase